MTAIFNMAIDAVQDAKTSFLSTYVKQDGIRKPLQSFVDSQTAFAKQLVKTGHDLATANYDALMAVAYPKTK